MPEKKYASKNPQKKRQADKTIQGVFQATGRGFGFVIRDAKTPGDDILIPAKYVFGAMNGDKVTARLLPGSEKDRPSGEIIKVTQRALSQIIGLLDGDGKRLFLLPDDKRLPDVYIRGGKPSAAPGDRAAVNIDVYPTKTNKNPVGQIIRVFGKNDDLIALRDSILYSHSIPRGFSPQVMQDAEKTEHLPGGDVSPETVDRRASVIFTIDGDDSKDFDDAVEIQKLEDGAYLLGVHIADVSHYVREGSPIDAQAYERGTSVYFPGGVEPMLPLELSTGICSLNPGEDRLAMSCVMKISKDGEVLSGEITKSLIKSCARLTYSAVNRLFEGSAEDEIYERLRGDLFLMRELFNVLRHVRRSRGSIDFDLSESDIRLDEKGLPVLIKRRERGEAQGLVEEFMVLANETVAKRMCDLKLPAVYRVHEKPDSENLSAFFALASPFGIRPPKSDITQGDLQKVLDAVAGKKESRLISTALLRSMMKARYDSINSGHYGLALKYYCHFTSPIRRYPDLVVHRMIKQTLFSAKKPSPEKIQNLEAFCKSASECSNERELAAVSAERDIDSLYKTAFMADKTGETFTGIISSVLPFGFFVELENTVEGLVRLASLTDEYTYDEEAMTLKGVSSGLIFSIGDSVRVVLTNADIQSRRIDFELEA